MRIFFGMIFLMVMGMFRLVTAQDVHTTDSIENVVMKLPDGTDKVDRMLKLCDDLIAIKDFNRAELYLDNAFSLSETLDYQKGIAGYYAGSGYLLLKQGDYDKALDFLDRAMKLDSVLGENSAMVLVYNRVALIHRFRGEYAEAISNYEAGISLAEQTGDTAQAHQTSLNLGIIYKMQGNNEKALEIFLGALPFYEKTDNLLILTPLDNCIGGIFFHQKEYDEALKHLNSALEASRTLGLDMDAATNLYFIGLVYRELGQFEEALRYEFQALEIYSEKGSKNDLGRIYTDIGDTYAASGDIDQALEYYYEALGIARELEDNEIKSACLLSLGKALMKKAGKGAPGVTENRYDSARAYLQEALNISFEMGQKDYIMKIYRLLYEADSASGDLGSALTHFKYFTLYKDSLNDIESKKHIAQLDYKFLRQQKEKEITVLAKENEIKSLQLKRQKMIRNGILFSIVLLILTGIVIFRSIQLKRRLEKQQAISAERERISGDLHDDVGSGLSKIILMLEVLNKETDPPEIEKKTRAISQESLELSKNMSGVIWALNSRYDSLESLIAFIRKYAGDYFENSSVRFKMNAPSNFPPVHLSSEQRRNIYYAVREALHNIVKHANASNAEMSVTYEGHVLSLTVKDNGVGLPSGELNRFGNGIIQMQKRLKNIGGNFFMENGVGTSITFTLPLAKNRP